MSALPKPGPVPRRTREYLAAAKTASIAHAQRQREPTPVIDWDAAIKRSTR